MSLAGGLAGELAGELERVAGPRLDELSGQPPIAALARNPVSARDYRNALVSLHGFCRSLEPILLARPEWHPQQDLGLPPGGRLRLLEQDLCLLGAPRGSTAPLSYLPPLTGFPEHAGACWCLARAPLTGGNGVQLMNGALPEECHRARSFIAWQCQAQPAEEVGNLLEPLVADQEATRRTLAAARATADGLRRWLQENADTGMVVERRH